MEISNRVWWERKPCPSEYKLEGRKRCVLTSFLRRYNQNFDDFLGGHAADQLDHLDLPSQGGLRRGRSREEARVSGEEGGEDNSRCWCHDYPELLTGRVNFQSNQRAQPNHTIITKSNHPRHVPPLVPLMRF
jgi:hypothetical protein